MDGPGGWPERSNSDVAAAHSGSPPSVDDVLDVLADAHRRFLLAFLRDQPGETCSFEAATEHVLEQTRRECGEQLDPDEVELQLCHRHLPKLADAGLVEYDARSETIRYRPDARLEALSDHVTTLQQE